MPLAQHEINWECDSTTLRFIFHSGLKNDEPIVRGKRGYPEI